MLTPELNENFHYVQNDPHRSRLNLKNVILISCAVMKLLRQVSQGTESVLPPPRLDRVKFKVTGDSSITHKLDY